jgi:hypothetical protein
MGATYTNMTIKGPSHDEIFEFVADRAAYVSPVVAGCVVLLDQRSEWDPEYELITLATSLSMRFMSPVLTIKVAHSDFMAYWLHGDGRLLDWYNSFSGEISPGVRLEGPSGGNPDALVSAFGSGRSERVLEILKSPTNRYPIADQRHADLVDELHLPNLSLHIGYDYLCRGIGDSHSLAGFRGTSSASC